MTESEEKAAFAQAMISANMNPLEAGQLVHPGNFNRAAQIASMWHNDAEVKAMIAELKKAEIAESGKDDDDVYLEEKLKQAVESADTWRDRIRAIEIYAEVKGKKKKEAPSQNVTVLIPKVIAASDYSTDKEKWESDLLAQQRELQNVSRSKH
jgi:hypothetical protein